jgi:uncharacterized protein YvpB
MLLLSLLLATPLSHAQDCGSQNVALIHDVSAAAMTEWSATVYDALSSLSSAADTAKAKEEAHAVADRVREALEAGEVTPEDAVKLLDAMSYLWNRADELEQGWSALMEGDYDVARGLAKQVADRIRQAADQGFLCDGQRDHLLAQAWRLWNMADGLAQADAATGEDRKAKAHETAELARQYHQYDQITTEQMTSVTDQAGRIWQEAEVGTDSSVSTDSSVDTGGTGTSAVGKVPYFNQYDNGISPGGSCQNTSVAMVLGYYGVNVSPDAISSRFGTQKAQTPGGAAEVFNHYAAQAGISQRMTGHYDGSFDDLKAELDKGHPVVINGYFTAGHVVTVTGYDDNGYYVNDPAGVWNERFKGGYAGQPYNGRDAYYGKAAFEQAVGTWNGYTPAPLYYTTIE